MANLLSVSLAVPAHLNPAGVVIRMAGTQDEPLVCLKDVCDVLGIENVGCVAERIDDDDKANIAQTDVGVAGRGGRGMIFVTESGLYTVLLRSDKPQAKPFRKWVTGEVLPCIRRHGCYPAPANPTPQPADLGAILRRLVAEEMDRQRFGLRLKTTVPPCFEEMALLDPREWVPRLWPEVSRRRIEDVVGRIDQMYRYELGRPAPKEGNHEGARRMCEAENFDILLRAVSYYWRKDHNGDAPPALLN